MCLMMSCTHQGLCPSSPVAVMDALGEQGAALPSPPLPASCTLTQLHVTRGCPSPGGSSPSYMALADLFAKLPRLSCRCCVRGAAKAIKVLAQPSVLGKPQPACNVISITILPLGTLTTRLSLIAPVICLSQQAAHPKQGD